MSYLQEKKLSCLFKKLNLKTFDSLNSEKVIRMKTFVLITVCPSCDLSQIVDPDLKLSQNCSLVSDLNYFQNACKSGEFYENKIKRSLTYCGNFKVAQGLDNCSDTVYSCINGFYWSYYDSQCVKQKDRCVQNFLD
ncbi:hypothetical protein ABPG74_021103 [Tetrahymena malaccensis]